MKMDKTTRRSIWEFTATFLAGGLILGGIFFCRWQNFFGDVADRSETELIKTLRSAREQAYSLRRHVAVVLPSAEAHWSAEVKPYCFGGYRRAFVTKSQGGYAFARWIDPVWRGRPDGVYLLECRPLAEPPSGRMPSISVKKHEIGGELIVVEDIPGCLAKHKNAVVFDPYGSTVNLSLMLAIRCGTISRGMVVPENDDGKLRYVGVTQSTGRVEGGEK